MKSPALLPLFALASSLLPLSAADVPATLPKPDDALPTSKKPVKIYVLAGQSNMVGFGQIKDARPVYPSIYLSADPSIVPCRMPVGSSALLPHGIYQSAGANAPKGALAETSGKQTVVSLGHADAVLPSLGGAPTIVVKAFIDVPMTGNYEIHAGHGDSAHAQAAVDGREVYRKDEGKTPVLTPIKLEQGKRYPVSITYSKGGSAVFWLKQVAIKGKGDLTSLIQQGKFPWFGEAKEDDREAKWTQRKDVTYREVRITKNPDGEGGLLSPLSNAGGRFIGPEIPFGYVMGTFHEEPVLLIESSMGNRSLNFDFRPPSSGRNEPDNDFEGYEYRYMVDGVRRTLANIAKIIPDYQDQGYEIAGFAWFQGHKDRGQTKEEYEKHLVNLIKDLRKDLNSPNMRTVVATVAFGGEEMIPEYREIHKAQMAVGDPKQHPEFAGNVASVDAIGFWRARGESPSAVDFHYNFNAETYVLTGDTMGREMVRLLGGNVEKIAMPAEMPKHPDVKRIYSDAIVHTVDRREFAKTGIGSENPTPEGYAKMKAALRPMIVDDIIPVYLDQAFGPDSARLQGIGLKNIVTGVKPEREAESVQSQLDEIITYYAAADVSDYAWKPFGPLVKNAKWFYHSFDPAEQQPRDKSNRMREITMPQGMSHWLEAGFKPEAAGWKLGQAPFGQKNGKLEPRRKSCYQPLCGCDQTPATLWEKEVLLMQQTFDMPAVKDGHAYRILLGGAGCDRSGEGYAVYINGKLLTRAKGGFMDAEGIRGTYLFKDTLPEFKGGKVTVSVVNFLRYTHHKDHTELKGVPVPPNGHVSLWMEEAKIPDEVLKHTKN